MATTQQRATVPFRFNGLPLSAIPHEEDLWLTGEDIGRALEYADPRDAIKKIYTRNKDELDCYSTVLKLPVPYGMEGSGDDSGDEIEDHAGVNLSPHDGVMGSETSHAGTTRLRPVRCFSEEGVMVLTMLSSQPKAAEFRAWAVGVLKAYRHGNLVISNPANRDRLLETCIKEVRFQNPAAIHTLVTHFGYPEDILRPRAKSALSTREMPPLVAWVVESFLPRAAEETRAGSGEYFDALKRGDPHFRQWRVVRDTTALLAIDHRSVDLHSLMVRLAAEDGLESEITSHYFSRWLDSLEAQIGLTGWSRRVDRIVDSQKIYRLLLREGGAA